jgi:AcrR family transcriptional regulator
MMDLLQGKTTTTETGSSDHPVEVTVGGQTLWASRDMAVRFVRHARLNALSSGAPLTVLVHAHGVDLFHITPATPVIVRDVSGFAPVTLWASPACPASAAPAMATKEKRTTMTDLHQRIIDKAYPLYTQHAVHDITRQQVEAAALVTAAQFDAEFESMDALAAECLKLREREWTIGIVRAGAQARADDPEGQLLAIFDVYDEWFHRDDYEACTFVNVLLEMGKAHPLGQASAEHLEYIRSLIAEIAEKAGLREPAEFALSFHILMKGSIINAVEGDGRAALRAKEMARDLIARSRPVVTTETGSIVVVDPRWAHG